MPSPRAGRRCHGILGREGVAFSFVVVSESRFWENAAIHFEAGVAFGRCCEPPAALRMTELFSSNQEAPLLAEDSGIGHPADAILSAVEGYLWVSIMTRLAGNSLIDCASASCELPAVLAASIKV